MMKTLFDIANFLKADFVGRQDTIVNSISSFNNPKPNSIVFIFNLKVEKIHFNDSSIVFVVPRSIKQNLIQNSLNLIFVENPRFAFAKVSHFFLKKYSKPILSKQYQNVFFGKNISIGENPNFGVNVVIEDNVSIGNNVTIRHNVIIHQGTRIGNNVIIDSGVCIGSEGFGNVYHDNQWHHISHLGSVVIEDNVMIGANTTIDRGTLDDTTILNGAILDNQVHIAHNVKIGENSAIAAKVGIAGSTVIGKRNMIGGMVGIIDHITTCDDVIISATSTVNKDINEPGTYTGIMPISEHITWKRIALWITKLDKIVKFINFKKS